MKIQSRTKRLITIALLAGVTVAVLSIPADAKKKKKSSARKSDSTVFTIGTDLGLAYDDNIINYSDADLTLFDSLGTAGKFAIKSKDDWILTPRIQPRVQGTFIGGKPASIVLEYDYYFYARNDVRRYSRFAFSGRQYFSSRGYVNLGYSYIPKYYYRNEVYGRDPLGVDLFAPARFSKQALSAEVGYDLTKGLKVDVAYQFQHKSFNQYFTYRNLNLHGAEIDGIWKASATIKLWTYLSAETAKAKGANDTSPTAIDVSYDAWDVTLGARHYANVWPRFKPEIFATFQYRSILFGTDNYLDKFRFNRHDNNFQVRLGTDLRLPSRIGLEISYAFLQKRANPDAQYAYLTNSLNYTSNTFTIRLSRDFQM